MNVTDRTAATDAEFRARFDRFGIFDEERVVEAVARAIQARLAYHRVVVRDSEASEAAAAAVAAYRAQDGGAKAAVRRVEALCDAANEQPDGYECRFIAVDLIRSTLAGENR